MINLCRPEDRWANAQVHRRNRANDTIRLAMAIIMEEVHPSHFGALPPHPVGLIHRAYSKDLITSNEYTNRSIYKLN